MIYPDVKWIEDVNGKDITTQIDAEDAHRVAIKTSGEWVKCGVWVQLSREQVVELIGNLVELLADLEA